MDMGFVLTQAISQAIGVTAIIYLLATMGLNIQFGYTGLLNFGQIAFVAVGSYAIGVFMVQWQQNPWPGWMPWQTLVPNLWVAILYALLLSVALSLILGVPTLRLRADYLAIVALAATIAWLKGSRIGKATRAVSDNPALASASGVNVERVISVVWVLGATLAAYAGIFLGITQNVVWTMGQYLLLTLFAAIVLGGLGTIGGAIVGSFVVGITVQLSTLIVPTELKTGAALLLMILLLLVRPQGLLGRPERVG